jgi:hypothetical protein
MKKNAIPKDMVQEIVAKGGEEMDISSIASKMVASGYQHPKTEKADEKEHHNPFTRDLEDQLAAMVQEGALKKEDIGGKFIYSVPE